MRGLYGNVLPEVFRTGFSYFVQKPKAILSRTDRANEVNKGFIIWLYCSDFVEKTRKHFLVAVFVVCFVRRYPFALTRSIWVICFSRI